VSIVVDASTMVEILLRSPTGRQVVGRLDDPAAAAPDILDAEVGQALRRARRRGGIDDAHLGHALDVLADWPLERMPSRRLVRDARRWWHNVSAYDSLYLAVAAARGATVLTCDGPLSRAPRLGVPVENVRVT
jgi:predicted nucleic acid-binding protein